MASMTIRNIDDRLKQRLRVRAAIHGRSMEDEARDILEMALAQQETAPENLAATIRARLQRLGGVELNLPARERACRPALVDDLLGAPSWDDELVDAVEARAKIPSRDVAF